MYKAASDFGNEDALKATVDGLEFDRDRSPRDAGRRPLQPDQPGQLLFAALLLADRLVDGRIDQIDTGPDPALVERANRLADTLEQIADTLEQPSESP